MKNILEKNWELGKIEIKSEKKVQKKKFLGQIWGKN